MDFNAWVSKPNLELAKNQNSDLPKSMLKRKVVTRVKAAGQASSIWSAEPFVVEDDRIDKRDGPKRVITAVSSRTIQRVGGPDDFAVLKLATEQKPFLDEKAFWDRGENMELVVITGDNLQTLDKDAYDARHRVLKVKIVSGSERDKEYECPARSVHLIIPLSRNEEYRDMSAFGPSAARINKGSGPA